MKNGELALLIAALPKRAALAGVRAHILHEGLLGNLDEAAEAFRQLWQCQGYEEIKAELAAFLVARYAYGGKLQEAQRLYAGFSSLPASAATLPAQATALHILTCMVMETRLDVAVKLWLDYAQLPIAPAFKKLSAQTGLAALRMAVKNSDSRSARAVILALCALALETGDREMARAAREIANRVNDRCGAMGLC